MDVDDDSGAAPMLVEPRPAEDHRLQPMSDELDGDGAPSTEDGVLLLPRGLFEALDEQDPPRTSRRSAARLRWEKTRLMMSRSTLSWTPTPIQTPRPTGP